MKRAIIVVIVIITIAITSNFLPILTQSTRRNEQAAEDVLIDIYKAEMAFKANCNGRFATLQGLIQAGLVAPQLSKETVSWYRIKVKVQNDKFELHAVPLMYVQRRISFNEKAGHLSFYINTDGIMRVGDHKGGEANQNDKSDVPSGSMLALDEPKGLIDPKLRPIKCP